MTLVISFVPNMNIVWAVLLSFPLVDRLSVPELVPYTDKSEEIH